jgi:S-adenosylmethionine:tRNA ribosyltransferase-isomerase
MGLSLTDFTYHLPEGFIANTPAEPRDSCKLMVVNRHHNHITHHVFSGLTNLLDPSDVLVLNQTKVFPARLHGNKLSGGKVELLLLAQTASDEFEAIIKPGLSIRTKIIFPNGLVGYISQLDPTGEVRIKFSLEGQPLLTWIDRNGTTPLPPYIETILPESMLRTKYQTVYAKDQGSAAAPTAGMHFTKRLLNSLSKRGIVVETLTLHVGLGTFQRLRHTYIADNALHEEPFEIEPETAKRLKSYKKQGKRVIAVGTTTARALESAANEEDLTAGRQQTSLFIYPPYPFKMIDGLITNFHLPQSSLLMMVAAFTSAPQSTTTYTSFSNSLIGNAYGEAISSGYRFFSFGDAMLIL